MKLVNETSNISFADEMALRCLIKPINGYRDVSPPDGVDSTTGGRRKRRWEVRFSSAALTDHAHFLSTDVHQWARMDSNGYE
ncbi:hypothetical protein O3Q51_18295 [Cryomorphaceae bacterium 1068]|nr:hypothetical protein [Cryomorphaceae bacterium 1068]